MIYIYSSYKQTHTHKTAQLYPLLFVDFYFMEKLKLITFYDKSSNKIKYENNNFHSKEMKEIFAKMRRKLFFIYSMVFYKNVKYMEYFKYTKHTIPMFMYFFVNNILIIFFRFFKKKGIYFFFSRVMSQEMVLCQNYIPSYVKFVEQFLIINLETMKSFGIYFCWQLDFKVILKKLKFNFQMGIKIIIFPNNQQRTTSKKKGRY